MSKWKTRWGYEMASRPTRPGIYRLKDGGFFVRSRVTDRRTGKRPERTAVVRTSSLTEAQRVLDELVVDARADLRGEIRSRMLWSAFAASRLEERVRKGKVMSEATVERWKDAIPLFCEAWGHLDASEVKRHHIDRWLDTTVAKWMTDGKTVIRKRRREGKLIEVPISTVIKPTTVNGWLRVLRAICHAVKVKFDLPKSAFEGIDFFEEPPTYTREHPNALPPDLLPMFMALARFKHPQHYAMILLGFTTGLRPSSLRPIRRKGRESDIDWEAGRLLVRRSHSRGQLIMNKTKTGADGSIALAPEVLDVLRAHVATLEGKAAASDLLFPNDAGGLRTRNILAKPFAAIGRELGLPFRLTPRGMRRTFQDVARAAGAHDVVTRSISGHQTERMQIHYSTAQEAEQRAAIAKAHAIVVGQPSSNQPQEGETKGGSTNADLPADVTECL